MRRSAGQRTVAIVVALLAQCLLIAPYIASPLRNAAYEPDVATLIFIQPLQTAELALPARSNRGSAPSAIPAPIPADLGADPAPTIADSITLPPLESPRIEGRVDWRLEMAAVAQEFIDRKSYLEERGNPLDSKAKVLQLPNVPAEIPDVMAERLGNGDLITKYRVTDSITVTCVHRQIPLAQHFEALARSAPALCNASERSNAVDLSSAKPGYLRKPLPKSRAEQDRE
jgi:hypothetical protein